MKKWFIADTHFSHTNIIKYANRPFANVDEMNQTLIKNWNQCVNEDDLTFFLGDFGLGTIDHLQSICSQLNGNKVCIRGNHDTTATRMQRIGFKIVLESAFVKIGRHAVELVHVPANPFPDHIQLHGHIHDKRPNKLISNQLNLCVEVWNYHPVSEKTLVSIIDKATNQ